MRKTLKKIAMTLSASAMLMAVAVTAMPNTADAVTVVSKEGKKAGKAKFDPEGTYHAYFGLQQTQTWIFRDPWYSETLGLHGTSFEGTDCTFNDFLQSHEGLVKLDAKITDAEITGNGFYTVSLEGINNGLASTDPSADLAMVFVDTDIPVSAKDTLQISDVKLYMDDMPITIPDEIFYNWEEEDESKLIRFDVVNSYQKDQGYYESPSVVAPSDSIKITFKVSGMAKDNPDAVEPTPTPEPEKDDAATDSKDDDSSSGSGGMSPALIGGIVVVILVVIGGVVVVTKKKK